MFWKKKKPEPKLEYRFDPQPDITAYELAKLLPLILHRDTAEGFRKQMESLPTGCGRHIAIDGSDQITDQLKSESNDQ